MAEVKRQKEGGGGELRVSDFVMAESTTTQVENSAAPSPPKNCRRSRPFIKGPIDLGWVQQACKSNAAEMAFYLHYKLGILGKGASVQIRPSECRAFGISDKARQRQIDSLEKADLIVADRGNGRCPVVIVIEKAT
ncbi:hypothetical protein OAH46_02965 [Verrucomicrobia bacterium]|nr:hypothetical protein [Verrucomicrobiota bacterium]MDB4610031.1 hypothetical protein [Verrucomicrobiota bacterium]